jgi:hypothetical protein
MSDRAIRFWLIASGLVLAGYVAFLFWSGLHLR